MTCPTGTLGVMPQKRRRVLLKLSGEAFGGGSLGVNPDVVSAIAKEIAAAVPADEDDPDGVEIAVVDRGIGIPSSDLQRIFERFYRVDRARSRDTGGTGLGLAIVRHIASNHGGDVRVTSREGSGSTFTFILPLADPGIGPHRAAFAASLHQENPHG